MELKTKPSKNIGIVGLGLIGGSLGLDLQKLGYTVYGITHREKTAQKPEKENSPKLLVLT